MNTLSRGKNPCADGCVFEYWLALDENEKIVGRIAGILNHSYNQKVAKPLARFGWLDFIDNQYVLKKLFHTVEIWAKEQNAEFIHGPLGFTSFDASGILVEGFDELPTVHGKYNYPYYPKLIETCGYCKEVDWVEYCVTVPDNMPERFPRMAKIVEDRNRLRYAKISSKKDLLEYANEIFQLINKAYKDIYGFTSLSQKAIDVLIKQFLPLLSLKYISIILNSENQVVGVGITMPSLSAALQKCQGHLFPFGFLHIQRALRVNDTMDTLIIAIDPDYAHKGVNALIFNQIGQSIITDRFTSIETTRELENNFHVQNLWNKLEYRLHKRSRCYIKEL